MDGAKGWASGEHNQADKSQSQSCSHFQGFEEDCAICFEPLKLDNEPQQGQLITHTLPCYHTFHEDCINKLRTFEQLKQVCPLCRASLPMTPEQICEEAGALYIELELWVEDGHATWDHPQAKRLMSMWLEASERGHAGAQCNYALMHMLGRCVPQDEAVGLSWYHKSAAQGNPNAMYNLGLIFELGQAEQPQNYETAAFWYRKSGNLGYARAQFNLGSLYEVGKGVAKNEATAAMWYRQSANQDYAASQCGLGILYEQGRGVERNDAEAVKWYRKAAEQGDAAAQTNLGTMINDGRGTGKSDKLAVRWYRKAAEQGYARAQCNLGYKYDLGEGVPQCDASAVYWYKLSAEQNNPSAQCNLAVMHEHGRGVEQNYAKARSLYHSGVRQLHVDSHVNLAILYETGKGGPKNIQKALKFLMRARELGDAAAQDEINRITASLGTPMLAAISERSESAAMGGDDDDTSSSDVVDEGHAAADEDSQHESQPTTDVSIRGEPHGNELESTGDAGRGEAAEEEQRSRPRRRYRDIQGCDLS